MEADTEMQEKERRPLLGDPAIRHTLVFVSLMLLGWPAIQIAGEHGVTAMFGYLFAVWAGLIVVLYVGGRALRRSGSATDARSGDSPETGP